MVLGRPTDAEGIANLGDSHLSKLATISFTHRIGTGLVGSIAVTTVGARNRNSGVSILLEVMINRRLILSTKGQLKANRVATRIPVAVAAIVVPVGLFGVLELPINTVGPGVSLGLRGTGEESQSGNSDKCEGRLENHTELKGSRGFRYFL